MESFFTPSKRRISVKRGRLRYNKAIRHVGENSKPTESEEEMRNIPRAIILSLAVLVILALACNIPLISTPAAVATQSLSPAVLTEVAGTIQARIQQTSAAQPKITQAPVSAVQPTATQSPPELPAPASPTSQEAVQPTAAFPTQAVLASPTSFPPQAPGAIPTVPITPIGDTPPTSSAIVATVTAPAMVYPTAYIVPSVVPTFISLPTVVPTFPVPTAADISSPAWPTPILAPVWSGSFSVQNANVTYGCGIPYVIYKIYNGSGYSLESLYLHISDRTTGLTLYGPFTNNYPFMVEDRYCTGAYDLLPFGGTLYVGGWITHGLSGHTIRAVIQLCTGENLAGACYQKVVDFIMP